MNISKKFKNQFTILFLLSFLFCSFSLFSDPLYHGSNYSDFLVENINNQKPNKDYVFSFKNHTYILEEYNISDKVTSYKAFTIKKENEPPFLYLIDTDLYLESSFHTYKMLSITVDSFIEQNNFSDLDLLKFIKKALKVSNYSYQFIHFKEDPYSDLNFIDLDTRFTNILLQKQSYAEKIGCSKFRYVIEEGNTRLSFYYLNSREKSLYTVCKKWLSDFVNLDHMQNSIKSSEQTLEKQECLDFLSDCKNRLGLYGSSTIAKTYQELEKMKNNSSISDELHSSFDELFLNFQNPLVAQLIKQIFDKGLDPENSFHKLIAAQILSEAETITRVNEINNFSNLFDNYDFKELFNNLIDRKFEHLKKYKSFPIERNLIAKMSDDEIKEFLKKRSFFTFHNFSSQEFKIMVEKALNCLNINHISEFYSISIDSLKDSLSNDLSWSNYIRNYNPEDSEHFLKWFFCYIFIKEYDDFFIDIASLWGYFFL